MIKRGFNMIKRILHIVGIMDLAGQETFIMNVYRKINKEKVQFDFLVHTNKTGYFDQEIVSLGGKIRRILIRNKGIVRLIRRLFDSYKFYRNNREYDTIHIHASNAKCILEAIPAKLAGVKRIIIHSHNINSPQPKIHYIFKPFIGIFATDYFACTQKAAEWMFSKSILISRKRGVKIIKNSIDTTKFSYNLSVRESVRSEYKIEDNFVIGHIGRFQYQKNHEFLIEVFEQIIKKKNDAMLLLIGEGQDKEKIKSIVSKKGLIESVKFLGLQDNIPSLLQAFDAFILPSHYEGFGIVAIESQAAGLVTVVSKNVPIDVKVTDLIEFVSLDNAPSDWAKVVIDTCEKHKREDTYQSIVDAGFDIEENAHLLELFYLEFRE